MRYLKTLLLFVFAFLPILFGFIFQQSKNEDWRLSKIPIEEEVGANILPGKIAQVKAPFATIHFERPKYPSDKIILSLSKEEINTEKIQKAIDELSKKGGGTVIIPQGEWFTGRIQFKDNINLHFEENAVLKFSGEIKDYLPVVFTRTEGVEVMSLGACIYANGVTNIAITGKGRLIGPAQGSVRTRVVNSDVIENVVKSTVPISERVYDGHDNTSIFSPMFISAINCKKVFIEGVSLENTAFWNIVPIYCDDVIIRGVTVNSVGIPRGDGIDIESSRNVLIEYCTLSCGDDCFTMKAGRGDDGIRINRPTENVVVRYCLTKTGYGGVTCGSETAGMIRNLYVHDCVFKDTRVGLRFKTRRPRGGGGENLFYERIRLNLSKHAFEFDMLGSRMYVGDLADRLPAREVNKLTPHYQNIHAKDILVENADYFVKVVGIPESPLNNFTIENSEVKCAKLFNIQDMKNSTFKNLKITSSDSVLTLLDSKNILFKNIDFITSAGKVSLDIEGEVSDSIFVKSCSRIKDQVFFK